MRNIRTLAAVSVFSIIALASCGGRGNPGDVKPSNAKVAILKALERCEYGALIVDSHTNDDLELRSLRGRRIGRIWSHASDEVFCTRETDLNTQYGTLDVLFLRSASAKRGSRWETVYAISIPMDRGTHVWKVTINPNTSLVGFTPVFESDLR